MNTTKNDLKRRAEAWDREQAQRLRKLERELTPLVKDVEAELRQAQAEMRAEGYPLCQPA